MWHLFIVCLSVFLCCQLLCCLMDSFVAWSGGLGHQKHVCYTPSFIMMAKVIADETVLGPDLLVIIVGLQAKT